MKALLGAAVAAAAAVALYAPSLSFPFVFDDYRVLLHPVVTGEAAGARALIEWDFWGLQRGGDLPERFPHQQRWRPLTTLSFAATNTAKAPQGTFGGGNEAAARAPFLPPVWAVRGTSLALHAVVSALVVPVAGRVLYPQPANPEAAPVYPPWAHGFAPDVWDAGRSPWAAGLAAVVFAVHPANSQAVLYATSRGDQLVALFALLALWAYTTLLTGREQPQRGLRFAVAWLVVVVCTALASLARETGTVVPLMCGAWDVMALARCTFDEVWRALRRPAASGRESAVYGAVARGAVLAATFVAFVAAREWTMAGWYALQRTSGGQPCKYYEFNPGYCHPSTIVRWATIVWYWIEYLKTICLAPAAPLSLDWSGDSIPVIDSLLDRRLPLLVLLAWICAALFTIAYYPRPPYDLSSHPDGRGDGRFRLGARTCRAFSRTLVLTALPLLRMSDSQVPADSPKDEGATYLSCVGWACFVAWVVVETVFAVCTAAVAEEEEGEEQEKDQAVKGGAGAAGTAVGAADHAGAGAGAADDAGGAGAGAELDGVSDGAAAGGGAAETDGGSTASATTSGAELDGVSNGAAAETDGGSTASATTSDATTASHINATTDPSPTPPRAPTPGNCSAKVGWWVWSGALAGVVVAALGGRTAARVGDWRNPMAVWASAVAANPRNVHAMQMCANKQAAIQDWAGAVRTLRPLLTMNEPPYWGELFLTALRTEAHGLRQTGFTGEASLVDMRARRAMERYCTDAPRKGLCGPTA